MYFKKTQRKFKDLLNGESVIVLSGEFAFNTTVKWEIADYLDDVPPFLEITFIERTEDSDAVYYTKDLDKDVYQLSESLIVFDTE